MFIRTPRDLGAAIRDQRTQQGLDQHELAARVGVSRQWIIEVEKGKPRAQVGLVLKTLGALGVWFSLETPVPSPGPESEMEPDLDAIIDRSRETRK